MVFKENCWLPCHHNQRQTENRAQIYIGVARDDAGISPAQLVFGWGYLVPEICWRQSGALLAEEAHRYIKPHKRSVAWRLKITQQRTC